jgi:hypothetical protein
LGEWEEATWHLDIAYVEAWADGPPHAFHFELLRVRAALKTLGLAERKLSPFDPEHIPPLPDEGRIHEFLVELKAAM